MPDPMMLVLPPGARDGTIAFGDHEFLPYRADHRDPASVWLVDMPPEIARHFIHNGGFAMVNSPAPAPAGMVRLAHPNGIGCSYGGVSYEPDEEGHVLVPAGAPAELAAHGFVAAGELPLRPRDPREEKIAALERENAELRERLAAIEAKAPPEVFSKGEGLRTAPKARS
jgi:hypothetical protein